MTPSKIGAALFLLLLVVGQLQDGLGDDSPLLTESLPTVDGVTQPAAVTSTTVGTRSSSVAITVPSTTSTAVVTTTVPEPAEVGLEQFAEEAEQRRSEMTMEQLVAQLFVVEVDPSNAGDSIAANDWGGVFLKMESSSDEAVLAFTSQLQVQSFEGSGVGLFVTSDVEGGRIVKMPIKDLQLPGKLVRSTDEQIRSLNRRVSGQLCSFGVNFNLAPVGDVDIAGNPVLRDGRSFGTDAGDVARFVSLFIEGYAREGEDQPLVATTVKHFPGHGAATVDSHLGDASVGPRATLEAEHLEPFRVAIDHYDTVPGAVMIGHLVVEGDSEPATFSRDVVTGWLRGDLGHEGLVVSDDLANMAAIASRSEGDRAELALLAGIDVLLWNSPEKAAAARTELLERVVSNPDSELEARVVESAFRILAMKAWLGLLDEADIRCGGPVSAG